MNEVQKKLYAKFQSALKKGDKKNLNNLLFEQVGVLLNTNRDGLIAAIRESGGKVESNVSDRDLAQKISLGIISKNEKFINKILFLTFADADSLRYSQIVGVLSEGISQGIGAIGNKIAEKKYGGDIRKAKAEEDVEARRNNALKLTNILLQKKKENQLVGQVYQEAEVIKSEQAEMKKKTYLIIGGGVAFAVVILIVFSISNR